MRGTVDNSGSGREKGALEVGASRGFFTTGKIEGSNLTTGELAGMDVSTLGLMWPQQLGRFLVSIILDTTFLFSKELGGTSFNVTFGQV